MTDSKKYIAIMLESLRKKEALLDLLLLKNEAQAACIRNKEYDDIKWDSFHVLIAEKQAAIDRLNKLDDGFETLYARVREELQENKAEYEEEIRLMQELITHITDKGVAVCTGEENNRRMIEKILGNTKKEIRQARKSLQVASSYYKSMKKVSPESTSRFMDKKK